MIASHKKIWGDWSSDLLGKIPQLFLETIEKFKPDLIATNIIDVTYIYAVSLLNEVKREVDIPVVAGGPTPTMSPEMVIDNNCIDIVCVGEGEDPLVELVDSITKGRDYSKIKNLWVKKNGKITKNPLRPLKDMDTLAFQDWTIFDERHYYKPYCGAFYRTGFFELARGCPFNCTFCCTESQKRLYHGLGNFLRVRNIDNAFDEVVYTKDKYNLELIFFIDDNFLGMHRERFDYFCQQYKKRVDLPFYIQTRSETIREDYIKKLKEVNISTIGIGIEEGDEDYRKKYLNRYGSNKNIQKAFEIVHKYGIRSTANVIIGMPYETENMFKETIKLLKKVKPRSYSVNYFQPYRGTLMREKAIELGYLPKDHVIFDSNICIDMPEFRKERQAHYYENLKKYLGGKLKIE